MLIDIQTAGEHTASELRGIQSSHESWLTPGQTVAVTILKILTLITGAFFSLVAITNLTPDLAFISVTLLTITTAGLFSGTKKIVAAIPRGFWVGQSHTPSPAPISQDRVRTWGDFWRDGRTRIIRAPRDLFRRQRRAEPAVKQSALPRTTSAPLPRARRARLSHSTPDSRVAVGGGHHDSPYASGGDHVPVGGGHDPSRYVGLRRNVAVGGGHDDAPPTARRRNVAVGGGHDHREVGPDGRVIPGSGLGRSGRGRS